MKLQAVLLKEIHHGAKERTSLTAESDALQRSRQVWAIFITSLSMKQWSIANDIWENAKYGVWILTLTFWIFWRCVSCRKLCLAVPRWFPILSSHGQLWTAILIHNNLVSILDVSSKQIHQLFLAKKHTTPTAKVRLAAKYPNTDIDWKGVYSLAFRTTLESMLKK